mmetsp:Transcript_18464/g.51804  ORF Transcript_18464/g.51804 Transcript_18464/m.51804 type:complete len:215 (+) Transcript_18464:938-1582(+)
MPPCSEGSIVAAAAADAAALGPMARSKANKDDEAEMLLLLRLLRSLLEELEMEGEEGDVGAWARRGANMRPRKAAGVAEAVLGAAPLAAAARAAAVEPSKSCRGEPCALPISITAIFSLSSMPAAWRTRAMAWFTPPRPSTRPTSRARLPDHTRPCATSCIASMAMFLLAAALSRKEAYACAAASVKRLFSSSVKGLLSASSSAYLPLLISFLP